MRVVFCKRVQPWAPLRLSMLHTQTHVVSSSWYVTYYKNRILFNSRLWSSSITTDALNVPMVALPGVLVVERILIFVVDMLQARPTPNRFIPWCCLQLKCMPIIWLNHCVSAHIAGEIRKLMLCTSPTRSALHSTNRELSSTWNR